MNIKSLGTAINSARSQSFGRRVYCIESTTGKYWVKQQLAHVNAEYERGFLNELEMYSRLNALESPDHSFLSNFSITQAMSSNTSSVLLLSDSLNLQDAVALFAENSLELQFSQVICILKQSLDVLENLHELGFIHGDLKVEHFRQQSERLCLIDFEQTCHLDDVKHMPNTATPRYMAPELFHAQPKSVQTDLYALGIIWLEWLTQEKLQAKSYQDWAFLHCQDLKIELVPKFYALNEILNLLLMKKKQVRCTNIYQIKQLLSKIG